MYEYVKGSAILVLMGWKGGVCQLHVKEMVPVDASVLVEWAEGGGEQNQVELVGDDAEVMLMLIWMMSGDAGYW